MTPRAQVQTIRERDLGKNPIATADKFFSEHIGIHKLLVVDDSDRLRGLFTMSDIERIMQERHSQLKPARDSQFRLLCGAALTATRNSTGELDRDRILAHIGGLVERGVDVVAVSTAHGFSKGVGDTVRLIRDEFPELPIIAGNVTSGDGVEYLSNCGANVIKVGQGPGSICTTRMVAGVGIPQLTALYVCSKVAEKKGVRLLADGGITKSGDIVKALTLSHGVICGGLLAGCREAPGEIMEINGKLYKQCGAWAAWQQCRPGAPPGTGTRARTPSARWRPRGLKRSRKSPLPSISSSPSSPAGSRVGWVILAHRTWVRFGKKRGTSRSVRLVSARARRMILSR